jgi:SH3-like domain-containing protein
MKWAQLIDANGKQVWVNSQNVTYVSFNDERTSVIHFTGSKDDVLYVKHSADETANSLR